MLTEIKSEISIELRLRGSVLFVSFFVCWLFWPGHVTWMCVFPTEIEPVPMVLETQNLYHWIVEEVPLRTFVEANSTPESLIWSPRAQHRITIHP